MSPSGPKVHEDPSELRPILKVVEGGEVLPGQDQSSQESAQVRKWQGYVVILLSVILVLVTSHMSGPSQAGSAQNLLTFAKQTPQQ